MNDQARRWSWPSRIAIALALVAGLSALLAGLSGRGAQSAMFLGHTIVLVAIAFALRTPRAEASMRYPNGRARRWVIMGMFGGAAAVALVVATIGAFQGNAILALALVGLAILWVILADRFLRSPGS